MLKPQQSIMFAVVIAIAVLMVMQVVYGQSAFSQKRPGFLIQ